MKLPCIKCGRIEPKNCSKQDCPYFIGRKRTFKKEFSGSTPNIFVGRFGYPDVKVGMLATEDYQDNDDPRGWSQKNTAIPDILDKRASLINSQFMANVKSFKDRFLEQAQLVAQSKKATDVEVKLNKAPAFSINYPPGTSPHGASVKLLQSKLTENVKIPRAVDKAVSDNDLKANTALKELYGKVDEYALQKLMTAGVLGRKVDRKLVPTRWSITATDDTLGKQFLEKVRSLPVLGEPMAYFGGHYGNYYLVMLFPRMWQYELFEFYCGKIEMKQKVWTDYEGYTGRTSYATDCVGGYYATRLPIAEKLLGLKKQAAVLCLRFSTDEYSNPLGVWVVREAVKKALQNKPLKFSDEKLMLKYAAARCKQYGISWEWTQEASKLLASFKQRTLEDF